MSEFQRVFNTNCTLPTSPYHWVTSGNSRGTIDILWSSLTALILCTWTIQHLNIPPQRKEETWRNKIGEAIGGPIKRIFCMVTTLVAPEMLIGKSLVDWVSAHVSQKEMQEFAELDGVEWTVTHGFYANMGGFVVQFSTDTPAPPSLGSDQKEAHSMVDEIPETSRAGSLKPENDILENTAGQSQSHGSPDPWTSEAVRLEDLEAQKTTSRTCKRTHKDDPNYRCPCRTFTQGKSNKPYDYMHLDDIDAHPGSFYNGRFMVQSMIAHTSRPWLSDEVQSKDLATNKDTASQALFDFARHEDTRSSTIVQQYKFDMRLYQLARLSGKAWALDAKQLLIAREMGIISHIPDVSKKAIDNESKGDIIVKGLAVFQIIYLVIQLAMRSIQHLDSSQLEVVVIAFASCAVIIYILCLPKPQDVDCPRYIKAARFPTPDEMLRIAEIGRIDYFFWLPGGTYAVANYTMPHCGEKSPFDLFVLGGLVGGVIFGSIHCATWNFFFPTPVERLLWRISSAAVAAMPLAFLLVFVPSFRSTSTAQRIQEKVSQLWISKLWTSKPQSRFWQFVSWGEIVVVIGRFSFSMPLRVCF